MSEYFESIVDVEATPEQARELAEAVVAWLVEQRIVAAERTRCVLSAEPGHPPAPNYLAAVTEPDPYWTFPRVELPGPAVDGLEVVTERRMFQMAVQEITCGSCAGTVAFDGQDPRQDAMMAALGDAVGTWLDTGESTLICPYCGRCPDLNAWRWAPQPAGFGCLGFTFWNWPPLRDDFVAEVGRRLGHRTILTGGRI